MGVRVRVSVPRAAAGDRRPAAPAPTSRPVAPAFYARDTETVARELVGKLLVSRLLPGPTRVARIVEVEAYLGERDAASHARRGRTPRSAIMFGPPGHLYVYLIYGMHNCMNVVTEVDGTAGAVLLRAAEPLEGFEPASLHPSARGDAPSSLLGARILAGPGKLCSAFGITRAQNGLDLNDGPVTIHAPWPDPDPSAAPGGGGAALPIKRSSRIGVAYAGTWADRKLRFYLAGNPHVSVRPRD